MKKIISILLVLSLILSMIPMNTVIAKSNLRVKNFKVEKKSGTTAKLSWKKIAGVEGYEVYFCKAGGKLKKIATTKKSNYTVKKLSKKAIYKFKIRAYKKSKGKTIYGKFSSVKSVNMNIPLKTTINLVEEINGAKVIIKWDKTEDASKYEIYRKPLNGSFVKLGSVDGNQTTEYVDETTEDGKSYSYLVKSCHKKYATSSDEERIDITGAPKIEDFNVSSLGIFENSSAEVVLFAKVKNANRVKENEIELISGTERVGYLSNNGNVSDGLFSLKLSVSGKAGDELKYAVKFRGTISKEVTLRVFDSLTKEDFDELEQMDEKIELVNSDYLVDGYIPMEKAGDAIDAVYQLAEEQKEQGYIIKLSKSEFGVTIRYASGLWYYYEPQIEGVAAGGDDVSLSIWTMQPYASGEEHSLETTIFDDAAKHVSEELKNCSFDYNLDNEDVNTDAIKKWSSNQIIIWNGHGGFDRDELGTLLYLGEKRTVYSDNTADYSKEECINGMRVSGSDGRVYISSLYIDNCVGSMENSFVYLGCCHGAQADSEIGTKFVDSLVNKGATVCAFSDTVLSTYDRAMLQSLMKYLSLENENTKYYYTISEAIELSKKEVGINDSEFVFGGERYNYSEYTTYLRLFGNENYRLSNECFGSLVIDKQEMSLKVGESDGITIITDMPKIYYAVPKGKNNVKITPEAGAIVVKGVKVGNTEIEITAGDKLVTCYITINPKKKDKSQKFKDGVYTSVRSKNKKGEENGLPVFYTAGIRNGKIIVKGGIGELINNEDIVDIRPYGKYVFPLAENVQIGYYLQGKFWLVSKDHFNSFFSDISRGINGQRIWLHIENGKVVQITEGLE